MEAILGNEAPDAPPANAKLGKDYCSQLFKIEEGLKDLYPKNLMPQSEVVKAECGPHKLYSKSPMTNYYNRFIQIYYQKTLNFTR